MPAHSFSESNRLVQRGGVPVATLFVLTVASALTGAVVALFAQRVLQRGQMIEVLPQPAPVPSLAPPGTIATPPEAASSSPLAAVGGSLSATRVAELERLLTEDDVVAGDGTDACPLAFPVKANGRSGIYHWPGAFAYAQTRPTLCFRTVEAAERAGFRPAKR